MYGSVDLANLSRDSLRVDITQGSIGKPCDKFLVTKALCIDNGAMSLMVDRLTIRDLK